MWAVQEWQVPACKHTSWVVAGRQQDTAGSFPYPNDVAGCGCAEDAILTDKQLLDTIGGTDLGNQLSDFWVPVTSVTANHENRSVNTLRNGLENAGDKGFRVVVLLEDLDLLTQTRTVEKIRLALTEFGSFEMAWLSFNGRPGYPGWSCGVRRV
jgi:hypothetical protein